MGTHQCRMVLPDGVVVVGGGGVMKYCKFCEMFEYISMHHYAD